MSRPLHLIVDLGERDMTGSPLPFELPLSIGPVGSEVPLVRSPELFTHPAWAQVRSDTGELDPPVGQYRTGRH